jgi:hypothetical protein
MRSHGRCVASGSVFADFLDRDGHTVFGRNHGMAPVACSCVCSESDPLRTFMNTLYDGKNFLKAGVRRKFVQESCRFQRSRTVEFERIGLWPGFSMGHAECVGEPV